MPSTRPPLGVVWALFRVFGTGDMKEFSNEFWYSISSGSFGPTYNFNGAIQQFYNAITPDWSSALTTGVTLRGAIGYFNDGTGTTGSEYYNNVVGTQTGASNPEDVAVVVRKKTSNMSKPGSGRWYFSEPAQADTVGSYLDSSGITNWALLAVQLKTAFTYSGVTFSPAHFSKKLAILLPIAETPVVGLLGTRRRRRGPF